MANRLIPFKLFNSNQDLTDANQVSLDTTNFNGNLDNTVTDVQELADAVDDLTLGTTPTPEPEIGAFSINIDPRVDLNTNLNAQHTVRFRAYNFAQFTSLALFVEEGGLFSTFNLTNPGGNGTQTQNVTLSSIITSSERTLNFYLVANGDIVSNSYFVRVEDLDAADVHVDATGFTGHLSTSDDDLQAVAEAVDSLSVDADEVTITATGFDGNLTTGTTNVQLLAQAVDDLNIAGSQPTATQVSLDDSSLADITANNVQEGFGELQRLFGIVRQVQQDVAMSDRPLNTFDSSVTLTSSNIGDFINRNNIYVASNDQRVNFVLPAESVVASMYPVTIELQHFGGTQRFDSGGGAQGPNNTIRITRPTDFASNDPSTFLRRDSETGTNLQFSALHLGDTAIVTKEDALSPWVVREGSTDPRSSILPNGVFSFNSRSISFPANVNGDHFIGGLSLYTPNLGDAFEAIGSLSEDSTFGRQINVGDVLVAKTDDPSLLLDENNDDWLLIRDAGQGDLTLTELRFLALITESDSFTYSQLEDRGDVNAVRLWLSNGILDHAPFINPSSDSNNPQGDGTRYGGGDELDTNDHEFQTNDLTIWGEPAGSSILPNAFIYVDIDGGFNINENINDIFVTHRDRDGVVINRYSLNNDFRTVVLAGSADTYYVFDDVAAADNFSSINYHVGQTLTVEVRTTHRRFDLADAVNVLGAIQDGSIEIEKLDPNLQALLRSPQGLTDAQTVKLAGLEATGTPTTWTDGPLYVKLTQASTTNDLTHYVNVRQLNGIIPNYDNTREVVFLVPTFVDVTGLQKVDDNSQKLSVTSLGRITATDSTQTPEVSFTGQLFSATLPAITGANSPLDNAWQIDGTASNLELTGAANTFKIDRENLSDELDDELERALSPYQLPDGLRQLQEHLTVTNADETVWSLVQPIPNGVELTREVALFFDFDAINTDQDELNEFEDLTDINIVNDLASNVVHYDDPNSPSNTHLPGVPNYVRSDNVRFRNADGETTPISTSFRKVLFFDYATNVSFFGEDQRVNLLRIGSGREPLLQFHDPSGLVLRKGFADVPTETRQVKTKLRSDSGLWRNENGIETLTPYTITLPTEATSGSFTATLEVGARAGGLQDRIYTTDGAQTQAHTFVINDVTVSQSSFPSRGYTWATNRGIITLTVNASYNHATRQLTFTGVFPHETGLYYWDLNAFYQRTEIVHTQVGYEDAVVNQGYNGGTGTAQAYRYHTMQANYRNRVGMVFVKAQEADTDTDPILGMYLIINGQLMGRQEDGYLIDLHRRASDFDFGEVNAGSNDSSIGRIQMYSYNPDVGIPSSDALVSFYNEVDNWLGAFDTTEDSETTFFIDGLDVEPENISPESTLTEPMQFYSDHLSLVDENAGQPLVWRTVNPAPIFSGLTRRFALFFREDKRANTGNVFNDISGIDFTIPTGTTRYYSDPNAQSNNSLPGVQSYILNDRITVGNTTGETPIPNTPNLILGFDYSVTGLPLEKSLIRFGGAVEPLLSVEHVTGNLVAGVGNQGGASRNRTYDIPIGITNDQWTSVAASTTSVIEAPYSSTTANITVEINLHVDGVDTANAFHTFNITNVRNNDQNFGTITFDFGGGTTLQVDANYTHSNRHLTLTPTNTITGTSNVYSLFARISTFEAWRVPGTGAYDKVTIAGTNNGQNERNRVLLMLSPYRLDDSDSDPELALHIIVNRRLTNTIRLHRPASDFDFNNITIGHQDSVGAATFAVGRVQFYNYDADQVPSTQDLQTLYSGIDNYLGAFSDRDPSRFTLHLDSSFEIDPDGQLILVSPDGSRFGVSVNDAGTLSTTEIT